MQKEHSTSGMLRNTSKKHFWFCSGSEPGMTMAKDSSIVHPITGTAVDYFILKRFQRKIYLTKRDSRMMVVDALMAHADTVDSKSPDRRIARTKKAIYYKCADTRILRIASDKIATLSYCKGVYFWHDNTEADQVDPDFTASPADLLPLLRQVFRISEEHELLFAALLLAFFDPKLVSPILVL